MIHFFSQEPHTVISTTLYDVTSRIYAICSKKLFHVCQLSRSYVVSSENIFQGDLLSRIFKLVLQEWATSIFNFILLHNIYSVLYSLKTISYREFVLPNSTEHRPSRGANSRWNSREISGFLRNLNVYIKLNMYKSINDQSEEAEASISHVEVSCCLCQAARDEMPRAWFTSVIPVVVHSF
jgi:hypothetical protein